MPHTPHNPHNPRISYVPYRFAARVSVQHSVHGICQAAPVLPRQRLQQRILQRYGGTSNSHATVVNVKNEHVFDGQGQNLGAIE